MDPNTEAIIRLAWARTLGLADDALSAAPGTRVYRVAPQATAVSFVRLFGQSAFVGPEWAAQRAADHDDESLSAHRTLLQISAEYGGRGLGAATLAFTDTYVKADALDEAVVSDEPDAVRTLERACPPDDVSEVGLAELTNRYVLLCAQNECVAGAGFEVWQGILAHMGALTALDRRRTGFGSVIAGLATNEALDAGLIPQWRAHVHNTGSRRLAAAIGYQEVGSQTSVLLPA